MDKYKALQEYISSLGSVAVAFSGGTDSTFLLKVAHDVLGKNAIAVTVSSSFIAQSEKLAASSFCADNNIEQITISVNTSEIDGFSDNPPDRCYICKRAIFSKILAIAKQKSLAHVVEGSNLDDLGDYRPGLKALKELGIKSPLREASLTKSEIREISHSLGLPTWDKPSSACLASRIPYGEKITPEKLAMIEHAENFLHSLGFSQCRARLHGSIARLEFLPEDFSRVISNDTRTKIYDTLKAAGFSYITLDLKGFRSGSMNETLPAN